MSNRSIFIILLLSRCCLVSVFGQKVVNHYPVFQTSGQSMWGPFPSPGINRTLTIFPEYRQDFPFDTSPVTILKFGGLKFGASIDGNIGFGVGPMEFKIEGFSTGDIGVDYPAEVRIILPEDSSFNAGETIVVKSEFNAGASSWIDSQYPQLGKVTLDMGVYFDARLGVQACFIDCLPRLSIIPPPGMDAPNPLIDTTFKFFEIDISGLTYFCDDPTQLFQCHIGSGGPPWSFGYGALSGEADLPNVVTSTNIIGAQRLMAAGSDTYINNQLDLIELIGYIPPAKPFTSILSSSYSVPILPDITGTVRGISFDWTLATIKLGLPITHKQEFNFTPKVITRMSFPDTLSYVVHSKERGNLAGEGPFVDFEVGDSISITFPCTYDFMDFSAKYSIDNTFSNKTFDNVQVNLGFEALKFGVNLDPYVIIPALCIPIPFVGDLCTPEIGFPGATLPVGPLIKPDPVTLVDLDFPPYFERQWELQGFNDFEVSTPFRLVPRKRKSKFIVQDVKCHGDSTGTIVYDFPNPSNPVKYEWSFGANVANPTNVPAGLHYLKTTDASNCVTFEPVRVAEPPALAAEIVPGKVGCHGDASATLSAAVIGGRGDYSYLWNTGETTPTISDKKAGFYEVIVTDESGCAKSASVTVKEPKKLVAAIVDPHHPSCFGKHDGSLDLFVEGGVEPYNYQWLTGETTGTLQDLKAGFYSVTVTDANNCTATDTITLFEPPVLLATLTKLSDISCFAGEDAAFRVDATGGTSPYAFTWFNEDIRLDERSSSLSGIGSGKYSVEVTDFSGCKILRSAEAFQPAFPLQASLNPSPVLCEGEPSGAVDLTVHGGTEPYQFQWSNGETDEDLDGITAGIYEVVVTDSNNCEVGSKTRVMDGKPIIIDYRVNPITCPDDGLGSIEVVGISGGNPPYTVQWGNGDTIRVLGDLMEGLYTLAVSDASDCLVTEQIEVQRLEADCFFIPSAFSPNGDGINDTWNIRNISLFPDAFVKVYNKWGTTVFSSEGLYGPWDGAYEGKVLEPATYYYIVDLKNGEPVFTGSLSILR